MRTTLRFLKKSRFPGQHEPIEPGTVREFEVGDEEGQMHQDVLDSLLRGSEPMAEELEPGEVAALHRAEAKAAAKKKQLEDEEAGKVPQPKPAAKKPGPPPKAKPGEKKSEPEGAKPPEA